MYYMEHDYEDEENGFVNTFSCCADDNHDEILRQVIICLCTESSNDNDNLSMMIMMILIIRNISICVHALIGMILEQWTKLQLLVLTELSLLQCH
jgi:hypothetical protein